MKKFSLLLLLFSPIIAWAGIVIPKNGENIEDVSNISIQGELVTYTQGGQQKSLPAENVAAVLYDDGNYEEVHYTPVVATPQDPSYTSTQEDVYSYSTSDDQQPTNNQQTESAPIAYPEHSNWSAHSQVSKVKTSDGQKQLFLGLNLGGGSGLQDGFGGYWAIGTDFAYPITQKFGLGAYLTFGQALYSHSYSEKSPIYTTTYNSYTRRYEERISGYNTTYYSSLGSGFHMTGGVQATIGDYSSNRACIVGLGGGLDGDASMADFRVGGIWKNGFYFFGNLDLGSGKNGFAFNMGFHFGYNFGRFIKCK